MASWFGLAAFVVTRASLVAALVLMAGAARAEVRGGPPGLIVLDIEVSPGLRSVSGEVAATVRNTSEGPIDELYLWLPFNRLERPPEAMDARTDHWIYPRAFAPGRIELLEVHVDGDAVDEDRISHPQIEGHGALGQGQRILARLPLVAPCDPGEMVELRARFRTTVPARFGRLGRAQGVLTLAGGFYPQVASMGPDGWELEAPLSVASYEVSLTLPPSHHAVVNEAHVITGQNGQARVSLAEAPYISLVVAPRFHVHRRSVGDLEVEYLSPRRGPRAARFRFQPGQGTDIASAPDITNWDYEGRALLAAEQALRALEDLSLAPSPGTVLRLVEVPLRLEMVSQVPGGALVSDRAYRVTPLESFHRFHDLQIARAIAWQALAPHARREALMDRPWTIDLLAAATADALQASRDGEGSAGLRDLLRIGAFIPEIDQLLYSPLIEFRHLFLRPTRDEDPVRDEPWRLASSLPRGAVLNDKLVDLLGAERVRAILGEYASSGRPLRELLTEHAGEPMDWFFEQWLGPYPSVNYRIASIDSDVLGDGGGYRHRVVVERIGAAIREPVQVRVTDSGGRREILRWDGVGQSGELTWESAGALSRVEVDPNRRLVEDWTLSGDNPRWDNVSPQRWRPPVFNGLMLYVSAAEQEVYALVDFALRRQNDARNAFRFRAEYEPRGVRGDLFFQRGLGRLLNMNRASWVLSTGVNVLRTIGQFGDSESDATALGAGLSLSHDTRWYAYDPVEGYGIGLGVSASGSRTDAGDLGWTVAASGRVAGHLAPRQGHTFTGYAGAGVTLGQPLPQQLQSVSDRLMLRAFEADETLGRVRVYAAVEYRWTMLTDIDLNLAHIAWLRTVDLVAFAGAGTVSNPDGFDGMLAEDRLFTEVGGGLRALLDIAGVVPYILAFDLGVPLTPRNRLRCVDGQCVARQPVGIYVSIQHTM